MAVFIFVWSKTAITVEFEYLRLAGRRFQRESQFVFTINAIAGG